MWTWNPVKMNEHTYLTVQIHIEPCLKYIHGDLSFLGQRKNISVMVWFEPTSWVAAPQAFTNELETLFRCPFLPEKRTLYGSNIWLVYEISR